MKKIAVLFIVIVLALIIDGTLTHDIFDYRLDSISAWLGLLLALVIFAIIALADSAKKDGKGNISE